MFPNTCKSFVMGRLAVQLWMWCYCWTDSYGYTVTYSCISTHFPLDPECKSNSVGSNSFSFHSSIFFFFLNITMIMLLHIGAKNMSFERRKKRKNTRCAFRGSCRPFSCLSSSTRLVKSKYYCRTRYTKWNGRIKLMNAMMTEHATKANS